MKILPRQHISIAVYTDGTVMVSAGYHDDQIRQFFRQFRDKSIQHFHSFCRWNRFVINISGDHQCVRLFLHRKLRDLMQNIFLIFPQITVDQF